MKQQFSDIGYLAAEDGFLGGSGGREQGANEVSSTIAPTYCLERVSRPWHKEGVPKAEPDSLPKLGRESWESREAKVASVHRVKYQRGESYTVNSGNLQGVPLQFSSECLQYWSGLEGTILGPQTEPRLICVPTHQSGNTS